ncbi:MAG: septum formation protein Maf [Clostridia bacterium]|nr:septum formation protein Maf [Clostridia bacterium]
MRIVLASGSPRRKELMEMLGVEDMAVIPAKGEEIAVPGRGPEETVMALSAAKAAEVAAKCSAEDVIVAADTIVWLDGEILGKPSDRADAVSMLRKLSGREHTVYSGVAVMRLGTVISEVETTKVFFRALTDAEIAAYVDTDEPMDKAGAYAAQGKASLFVSGISGDFFNVMGLPLCRLGRMLIKVGVNLI